MGPKYEFTGETKNYEGHLLHRIRRLSDGKLGGWIESEANLSQEGNCWVDDEAIICDDAKVFDNAKVYELAIVYNDAKVYGEAEIYDSAYVYGNAKVYDYAKVYGEASVYGNAEVYDNAIVHWESKIYGNAKIYGDAQVDGNVEVYGNAQIYGNAVIWDNTKVYGNTKIIDGKYTTGEFSCNGDLPKNSETKKVVQDFIYKVNDSNKLKVKTEYSSIDEYFNSSYQNDIKLDTLIIGTIDTKIPIIKLEKIEKDEQLKYKFIVDLTTENEDHFLIQSFIETKEQLEQKLTQTVDALNQYPEFNKYTNDLSNCICD